MYLIRQQMQCDFQSLVCLLMLRSWDRDNKIPSTTNWTKYYIFGRLVSFLLCYRDKSLISRSRNLILLWSHVEHFTGGIWDRYHKNTSIWHDTPQTHIWATIYVNTLYKLTHYLSIDHEHTFYRTHWSQTVITMHIKALHTSYITLQVETLHRKRFHQDALTKALANLNRFISRRRIIIEWNPIKCLRKVTRYTFKIWHQRVPW